MGRLVGHNMPISAMATNLHDVVTGSTEGAINMYRMDMVHTETSNVSVR